MIFFLKNNHNFELFKKNIEKLFIWNNYLLYKKIMAYKIQWYLKNHKDSLYIYEVIVMDIL